MKPRKNTSDISRAKIGGTSGEGVQIDPSGRTSLKVAPYFYFDDRGRLQLRVGGDLVISPGSPQAVMVRSLQAVQITNISAISSGGGGGSPNLDGGVPNTDYGGTTAIDGMGA